MTFQDLEAQKNKIIAHVNSQPLQTQHLLSVYENVKHMMKMKTSLTKAQKKEVLVLIKNKIIDSKK